MAWREVESPQREFWSSGDVGKYFGVPPTTVRTWAYRGHLEAWRVGEAGGKLYFRKYDIVNFARKKVIVRHSEGKPAESGGNIFAFNNKRGEDGFNETELKAQRKREREAAKLAEEE